MNKSTKIYKAIVLIAGIFNSLIGFGMIAQAFSANYSGENLVMQVMPGVFIIFMGAVIIWAGKQLNNRAPVIVWNGLVRLFNAFLVAYVAATGELPIAIITITAMDFILALVFIVGTAKVTGIPFSKLVLGKK